VKQTRGPVIEVDSVEEFDRRIAAGATSTNGWHLRSLDLTERGDALRSLDMSGALFLGCTFADGSSTPAPMRGRASRETSTPRWPPHSTTLRSCSRSATRGSFSSPASAGPCRRSSRDACENYYADEAAALIAATPRP
jgi:hypothetical protein